MSAAAHTWTYLDVLGSVQWQFYHLKSCSSLTKKTEGRLCAMHLSKESLKSGNSFPQQKEFHVWCCHFSKKKTEKLNKIFRGFIVNHFKWQGVGMGFSETWKRLFIESSFCGNRCVCVHVRMYLLPFHVKIYLSNPFFFPHLEIAFLRIYRISWCFGCFFFM